ncbi:potassium transporter Kup [Terrarubrum flagellatum]|uniref:potassium transporter Kup n=1 Tax=Terrirubrum flagellatum TaxID=2895980 RepID=UPI0031453404
MGQITPATAEPTAPVPDAHAPAPKPAGHSHHPEAHSVTALALGAIGVVYGDIGTSPLYALRETVNAATGSGEGREAAAVAPEVLIGVISLILWSLILIVTVKYVMILMRADNNGEGGTLTLVALAHRVVGRRLPVLILGMAGSALFFGDAVITPAISVLSAVEGLKLVTPVFEKNPNYIIWISVVILLVLFGVQSRGTARVAAWFGPITLVWFLVIGALGLWHIFDDPRVLAAINPWRSVRFFVDHPGVSLVVLGSVCLAVTGAEALYADMGHFGRKPIQAAWATVVFPALALNYLGQGALILSNPTTIDDPFYKMAPDWFLLPLVILATAATIIASQAVITGAFSLTQQAIQLGILPRLEIRHTSETQHGQIYMPRVNSILRVVVIALVLVFQTSSSLAHAYGISVFGTMTVTTVLAIVVIWKVWKWKWWTAALLMAPFVIIEFAFLSANLLKFFQGGFVPVLFAVGLIFLMTTWVKGNRILFAKTRKADVPLVELVGMLAKSPPHKVSGTAVFLTSDPETAPTALLHNLKHNKVLHEKNVVLTIKTTDTPRVPDGERISIEPISEGFWRVKLTFGYMESPNVPRGLAALRKQGFKFDIMSTSFFLSRRAIRPAAQSGMSLTRDKMFIALARNATDATDFFQIPTGRVVEVGTQVTV